MFRLQIGKLRLSAQFQPERSAWELNSLVGLREEKDADQEKGQAMDRTPRIPSRALGSRSAASAARSAAGSGALEVRADPKGNLGKPRSGIPPTTTTTTASLLLGVGGRRRAQFPQPGRPISLRAYAGAQAGAQGCWR